MLTAAMVVTSAACYGAEPADSVTTQSTSGRTITPVMPSTNTTLTPPRGTDEKIIKRYLEGDTVSAREEERKDSLKRIYPHYPLLTDITVGINIGDPLAQLLGQKYGGIDVSATLNMWNRLQPVLEFGLGRVTETPDELNYTYRTPLSPYLKLGANYNFLYKSEPKYQLIAGARLGATTFKYDVTDISLTSGYWREQSTAELRGESSRALWCELLAGVRVEVWRHISLGWQLKWHTLLSCKDNENSRPWYIPGMGDRERHWSFAFNICYTIPLNLDRWPKIDDEKSKRK